MNNLYDNNAEESVLGSMILRKEAVMEAIDICTPDDFYNPLNARVFNAMCELVSEGRVIDLTTVGSKVNDPDIFSKLVGFSSDVPNPLAVAEYARIVYDKSVARNFFGRLQEIEGLLKQGEDPYESASMLERFIADIGTPHGGEPESITIEELYERSDSISPVVIPGMMKQDYRTIIVGAEGGGKSVLLRTIGITASQGVHPFSHSKIKPIRVLHVDLENPAEGILETGYPLMLNMRSYSSDFDSSRFKLYRKPGGIDIRRASDRSDLQREIAAHRPDLVCIGPVYKMYQKKNGETYEDSADDAMRILDNLRFKYNFALLLEHHATKGEKGNREMSPFGSQRWMAWPEAGVSLYTDKADPTIIHVKRFRGDRLKGVEWPDTITRDRVFMVQGTWTNGIPKILEAA